MTPPTDTHRALLASLCDRFAPDPSTRLLVVAPGGALPPLAAPGRVHIDPAGRGDGVRSRLTGLAAFDVILVDAQAHPTPTPLDEWLLPGGLLLAVGDAPQLARWRREAAGLRGLIDEPPGLLLAGAAALWQVVGLRRVD